MKLTTYFAHALPAAALLLLTSFSQPASGPNDLLNKPAPLLSVKTMGDETVGDTYYQGKVTLLHFMFVGDPDCMKQLPSLNELYGDVESEQFQMLAIAAHTPEQMSSFNAQKVHNVTPYSQARQAYRVDPIPYPVVAECAEPKPKAKTNFIEPQCNPIASRFFVNQYPATVLIDKKGVVRKVYNGVAATRVTLPTEPELKAEIQKLLAE